jgi:DNA helicase-2/ATP-dependent DNA helicase PcrA
MVGTHDNNWENKNDQGKVKVPDLLNRFIIPEADSDDDMRRLLYVACTRAKVNLSVSSYKNHGSKIYSLTRLLSNYRSSANVIYEEIPQFDLPKLNSDTYHLTAGPELIDLIKEKVKSFEISPSSTAIWEKCQNEFLFNSILKVPGTSAEIPAFGTLFHEALRGISANSQMQTNRQFISNLIEDLMRKFQYNFHSTHIEKFKSYAKFLVEDYLRRFPISRVPNHIEETFHTELPNGARLKGQLDRVEVDGNHVKVIDYKTGRTKGSMKPYISEDDLGTQYWRQAMIYTMLMVNNFKSSSDFKFEFHYPEHKDSVLAFQYEGSPEFDAYLGSMWNSIQNLQFKKSCGNENCIYCKIDLNRMA